MKKLLHSSLRAVVVIALLATTSACEAREAVPAETPAELPELGLMGTIPIFWGEAGDFGELLAGKGEGHWARARLEAEYTLRPLDMVDEDSLAGLDYLLLAQPRPLTPDENVALDAWVRDGGKLLLFADPMLTGESRYAIGDRRRPQDVILLSPILTHWGLTLAFDDEQPSGYATVRAPGTPIPVNLAGTLAESDHNACRLVAGEVLASCAVGEGRVVVLADAALLDLHEPHPASPKALDWLVEQAFVKTGDGTGLARNGLATP